MGDSYYGRITELANAGKIEMIEFTSEDGVFYAKIKQAFPGDLLLVDAWPMSSNMLGPPQEYLVECKLYFEATKDLPHVMFCKEAMVTKADERTGEEQLMLAPPAADPEYVPRNTNVILILKDRIKRNPNLLFGGALTLILIYQYLKK